MIPNLSLIVLFEKAVKKMCKFFFQYYLVYYAILVLQRSSSSTFRKHYLQRAITGKIYGFLMIQTCYLVPC